jgi:hypothetical protein
MHRPDYQL